jgi:hypothetical protein
MVVPPLVVPIVCVLKVTFDADSVTCGVPELLFASGVQVFVAVHPYKLKPGEADVLKKI